MPVKAFVEGNSFSDISEGKRAELIISDMSSQFEDLATIDKAKRSDDHTELNSALAKSSSEIRDENESIQYPSDFRQENLIRDSPLDSRPRPPQVDSVSGMRIFDSWLWSDAWKEYYYAFLGVNGMFLDTSTKWP